MYQLHHTRVSRQHCVIASFAALVYFIRKRFSQYKTHANLNVDSLSDDRSTAGTPVVTAGSGDSSAAADGSLATTHGTMEEGRPRVLNSNPMVVPSTLLVIDIENDDQEKSTIHEYSTPSKRRQPEEKL